MFSISSFIFNIKHSIIFNVSTSYFIYDVLYIFYKQLWFLEFIYIIHHISAICIFHSSIFDVDIKLHMFKLAELSNLFTYFIYHKLKTNSISNLKLLKYIQFCWFSFIRIILFSYYYIYYFNIYKSLIFYALPLYLFGIVCSLGQYQRLNVT